MARIRPWVCGLFPALLIACGDRGDTIPQARVRDSAGVRIVENTGGIWQQGDAWSVGQAARLDIGSAEGDPAQQLFGVVGAARLPDGHVVVANAGSQELLFFDAAGNRLFAAGRKGGGPGEFQTITWMHLRGDSLLVFDRRAGVLSVFGLDGRFGRSARVPGYLWGVFSGGTGLATTSQLGRPEDLKSGLMRPQAILVRYTADGQSSDTIGTTAGQESYLRIGEGTIEIMRLPFSRMTWNLVHENRFYMADNDTYRIDIFGADGVLQTSIRKSLKNLVATEADLEAYIETRLRDAGDDERRRQSAQAFRNFPMPETFPAFGWNRTGRTPPVLIDDTDHLWVLEYNRPGDEEYRWSVFDPEGGLLGEVVFPVVLEPMHIGDDFVLGKWRDGFDVEHVRLYDLIKPR